jgi:hypothetical protein
MRPITALHGNVVDLNAIIHPGTVFERPRDVVSHPTFEPVRETRHPGFVGIGRIRDRIVPVTAGARGAEGAGHYRRDFGGALRAGRRPPESARRQADAAAPGRAGSSLGDDEGYEDA